MADDEDGRRKGPTDFSDVLIQLLHWRTLLVLLAACAIFKGIVNGDQLVQIIARFFETLVS